MKKTGQAVFTSIAMIFSLCKILFLDEPLKGEIMDCLILVPIAWFAGRQYDKIKFYGEHIKESEKNYKRLIEMLPHTVIIHKQNMIEYINNAGINMIGAQGKEEILGRSIYDFISPNYQQLATNRLKKLREENTPTNSVEQKLICLDGKIIFVEISSRLIIFEGKEHTFSIIKDVTDEKVKTESLLQNSEKLAVVGKLAAGIAHEIRNPLTSIKGFIQLFKSKYKGEEEYFNLILSELERINLIVGEFLVLAKPAAMVYKEEEINRLIKNVVTLINTQAILSNVQISLDLDSDLPLAVCEKNQLKQVFINVLKNAVEAMPNGGAIEIKTKAENNKISIYFIDHGPGIPQELIPKLGEPFYTTKEKGTGLGLMTSYKIIENHDGELKISSKVDEGTTIEVILPAIPQLHLSK